MTAEDFEQQPRGAYLFNHWIANQRVPTSFGEFTIDAHIPSNDTHPPDERMLKQAAEMAAFVRGNSDKILDKVYEHYQTVSQQGEWMQTCGVPTDLTRDKLPSYLLMRSIVVDREEPEAALYIVPRWDEEHAIYLRVQDGQVEFQDP